MSICAAVREIILTIQRKPENHLPKLKYYSKYRSGLFCVHSFFNIGRCRICQKKSISHSMFANSLIYIYIIQSHSKSSMINFLPPTHHPKPSTSAARSLCVICRGVRSMRPLKPQSHWWRHPIGQSCDRTQRLPFNGNGKWPLTGGFDGKIHEHQWCYNEMGHFPSPCFNGGRICHGKVPLLGRSAEVSSQSFAIGMLLAVHLSRWVISQMASFIYFKCSLYFIYSYIYIYTHTIQNLCI